MMHQNNITNVQQQFQDLSPLQCRTEYHGPHLYNIHMYMLELNSLLGMYVQRKQIDMTCLLLCVCENENYLSCKQLKLFRSNNT